MNEQVLKERASRDEEKRQLLVRLNEKEEALAEKEKQVTKQSAEL